MKLPTIELFLRKKWFFFTIQKFLFLLQVFSLCLVCVCVLACEHHGTTLPAKKRRAWWCVAARPVVKVCDVVSAPLFVGSTMVVC